MRLLCDTGHLVQRYLCDYALKGAEAASAMIAVHLFFQVSCTSRDLVENKYLWKIMVLIHDVLDTPVLVPCLIRYFWKHL